MSAHNIRWERWWCGRRSWTFPPILQYILLLWDKWQQRGSPTEWHPTWKCVGSKGVPLNSSVWKKMALVDSHWSLLNIYGDQTWDVNAQGRLVVCFSSGNSGSPLLVQIDSSAACMLLFTTGKNAPIPAVTIDKQYSVAENSLSQIASLCWFYLLYFPWKYIRGITFRATNTNTKSATSH